MEIGGWSLDQLMELAGLSASQAGNTSTSHHGTDINMRWEANEMS